MADLGTFLRDGAARRREPGVWDCSGFPAAWVIACGFPDPMARWRGTYETEIDGERLAEKHGLVEMFDDGLSRIGVPVVAEPYEPGDVAVVSLLGRQAGAIYTGERWAFVGTRGLAFAKLSADCIVRAWGTLRNG